MAALAATVPLDPCDDDVVELCPNAARSGECADANCTVVEWLPVGFLRDNLTVKMKDQAYRTLFGIPLIDAVCSYPVNINGIERRY